MKKTILSLFCVLALCLGLLPTAALAAEGAPNYLFVGNQNVKSSEDTTYWATNDIGELELVEGASDTSNNWSVKYDPNTATLTLKNATIKTTHNDSRGAVIYAQSVGSRAVSLTIELEGRNTIDSASCGIYVNAEMSNDSYGTDASLTITGKGSLDVSGSNYGIWVKSGSGSASLTIEEASVNANTTAPYSNNHGVYVMSGTYATSSPVLSLAVNGGSLTTSGSASGKGIQFHAGAYEANSATTSLTVTGNAIVDARTGGISASSVNITPELNIGSTGSTGGIVFDGTEGTVYGDVTLDESLTIAQGETLTIPEGASLNTNGNLTNGGTIVNKGTLTGNPGGTVIAAPAITKQPDNAAVTVGQPATFTVAATGTSLTYQWQYSVDKGQNWTAMDGATSNSYTTAATTLDMNGYQYQCVVGNTAGSVTSAAATLTVQSVPVTSVTLDNDTLSLVVDDTDTLNAIVKPDNATNQALTWSSSDETIATVDQNGQVTAKAPGTATITATANDGSGQYATCTVTVTQPVTSVTLNKTQLNLVVDGTETLTATVQPDNATDKTVTWSSDAEDVATVDATGKVTAVKQGEATITATANDGSGQKAACTVTVAAKTYTIQAAPATLTFGAVQLGYTRPDAQTVTITNTGNQPVTVELPTATNFDIAAGEGFTGGSAVIQPGKTAAFTVQPKADLPIDTYSETLTVTGKEGAQATVPLSFTVNPVPVSGVTLNKDTLSLFTGDKETLTAAILPANATNQNLLWGSDNGNVATVNPNGRVSARAAGKANITVTTLDGNFKASCAVTVTDKTYTLSVDVAALDFGAAQLGYTQPAAQTVTVTNTGNQTVTLNQPTATNFQVGTLSATSLAPGQKATFTVQPKAGLAVGQYAEELTVKNQNGGEANLSVTFTVNPVPVTGVALNQNTLALFAGDSATLTAAVTPDNATNKTLTWSTSNAAVATVDQSGKVTAVAPGTAAITVATNDGSAKTAACAVTVTAKTYSMSIDPGAIGFGNVQVGYTQPAVREVVVKNTGNQPLTLTQPTANNYQVGSLNQFTVAPGDTAVFTVQPKAGLLTGSYNETVVVSAAGAQSVSVNLTFSVGGTASSGTATTEKRTLHFDTNGGLAMADVVRGLGAPVELWPYTPVRAGYLFQGWYSDQALTKAVSTVVLTKDTTIYAKWAVDPAAAAAAQSSSSGSGSSGKGSGSGSSSSGSSGKDSASSSATVTVTPSPTVTPTPAPTATPTATPEASAEPETDGTGSAFPVVPVAAGVIVLVVLVGGIVIFRRFRT